MRNEFTKGVEDKTISPRDWLKTAYIKIDATLEYLMWNVKNEEVKEMEDYLKNTDDELAKAIWLIAGYDAETRPPGSSASWMMKED